jgi:hypothetical protein
MRRTVSRTLGILGVLVSGLALLCVILVPACRSTGQPSLPGQSRGEGFDEARAAGRTPASFTAADEDYFHDMDGGVKLEPGEVKGRNTWIVWTGGNDRFWDVISAKGAGTLDYLKTLSSYPKTKPDGTPYLKASRDNRWRYLGLVNEPCFEKATGPDRYGLWLDQRRADCPLDPFEDEKKYPGVAIGARGKNLPVGSYYGRASGIVGMRLFPNPYFDEAAEKRWKEHLAAESYYTDPSFYFDKDLVKPYRVGVSCGFCHVGPNPVRPPADPENPKWENLSSNVGAQYFWTNRIFSWEADPTSFAYQVFNTYRPGALDTSLISTDYIDNPRTMNAIYHLGPRLELAKRWGKETLAGGSLNNAQFTSGPLAALFQPPATSFSPRVLKDGSDSVGALGALNRVYLNIGLFSEEWLKHFIPLIGGKKITPIEIKVARAKSSYWQATEAQTPDVAAFFLASTAPHHLRDAPGGTAWLTGDEAQLTRGKVVFAERCARCHSSKIPAPAPAVDEGGGCSGPRYLECWKQYWDWTKTDDFKQKMRQIVLAPDFLEGNYLSTELRVPVTLLETNACSPLATNAIAGNIWSDFSSKTYKQLPSVGEVTIYDPFDGTPSQYSLPGGGRGYTRPASLVSLWSTAPFLQNNTVGKFRWEPSVEARMDSFQDSIEKMLWPEKRERDPLLGDKIPGPSLIDRTTGPSYLRVPAGYLPDFLTKPKLVGLTKRLTPAIIGAGGIEIGPIPTGTPVNLLTNVNLVPDDLTLEKLPAHLDKLGDLLHEVKRALALLPPNPTEEQAHKAFDPLARPLFELSKCKDFVVNRGHYFGTSMFKEEPGLNDEDKRALIEFLKTF